MGFWGTVVIHRDERLLWELLPDIAAHRGGDEADPRAALVDRLVLARPTASSSRTAPARSSACQYRTALPGAAGTASA